MKPFTRKIFPRNRPRPAKRIGLKTRFGGTQTKENRD